MRDTRYRFRPFALDAVQVTEEGWPEASDLLRRLGIAAATELVPVKMVRKDGVEFTRRFVDLFTPSGRLTAGESDWVTWEEDGYVQVWCADAFEAHFEPCGLAVRPPAP